MSQIFDEAAREEAVLRRRAEIGGGGLRRRVASGTLVNSIYLVALNGLAVLQGVLLARLLGAGQYGLWGLLAISFGTLFTLAALGLDDKYIQQDHPDQRAAFEVAFTLQSMLCGVFTVIALIAVPLFSVLYREPRILVPGLLLAAALPLIALQTPTWVFYRRMNFAKQRLLESCNPVVSFVVTIALAIAGFGFWSLVIGALAGSAVASAVTVHYSPYKLRFRYERGAIREYATFSWPLFASSVAAVLMFQVPITIAARSIGVAAVGAITLASQVTRYTQRVDDVVTHALYPAICVVKDRRDLLFESFSKSNGLAVLWGLPVGVAAALFAHDIVRYILGERWALAITVIQVLGVTAAVDQIGFNWTAFARARGQTWPLGVAAGATFVVMLGVSVPLLILDGLVGFPIGLAAGTAAGLVVRLAYLSKLFPARRIAVHVAATVWPTAPAAAAVLAERAIVGGGGSPGRALGELAGYAALVAGVTWFSQRALLREAIRYVRGAAGRAAEAPAAVPGPLQPARVAEAQSDPATRLA